MLQQHMHLVTDEADALDAMVAGRAGGRTGGVDVGPVVITVRCLDPRDDPVAARVVEAFKPDAATDVDVVVVLLDEVLGVLVTLTARVVVLVPRDGAVGVETSKREEGRGTADVETDLSRTNAAHRNRVGRAADTEADRLDPRECRFIGIATGHAHQVAEAAAAPNDDVRVTIGICRNTVAAFGDTGAAKVALNLMKR